MATTDDAVTIFGLMCILKNKKPKKRNLWCDEWLLKINEYSHTNLLN